LHNDLTFFTNEPGASLLDRFKKTLKHVQFFDVLVGYFRTSGFYSLYESFENIEKVRILVGLNVDKKTYEIIESYRNKNEIYFESHKHTREHFTRDLINELDNSEDNYETEVGVKKFIELLTSSKLEIKAYPSTNIHAKVYISRFYDDQLDYGRVITGSSNFSESGFIDNYEFNVELKNSVDVGFALNKFEALWNDAVDLSSEYVETVNTKTWFNDQITPYELYLKFLYEYLKEDINEEELETYLPQGYKDLKYQRQAVIAALKILNNYNGVFLADVVGLGKTYISALLAQQLPGRKLIICPPILQDYWKDTFFEFGIRSFKVVSQGKLDEVIKSGTDIYDYVFVDEAHRFRNEITEGFEKLHQICFAKKVILVSATPLNNKIDDIFSQLKLFQVPKRCTIPGVSNLNSFFQNLITKINKYSKQDPQYGEAVKQASKEVREKILKYVMVRRTRNAIQKYFSEDIIQEGLFFPEMEDPQRLVYEFDDETDLVFTETIKLIGKLSYSRYSPLLFLKESISEFEKQSQRNLRGFMKSVLVKRLESSFFAFINTLNRFIGSYEKFITMLNTGTVYISRKVDVYQFLENDNEARLIELVEQDKAEKYDSTCFRDEFLPALLKDLEILQKMNFLWSKIIIDPKITEFVHQLKNDKLFKKNKLIIFTESKETGEYLLEKLSGEYPDQVFFYCSSGGLSSVGSAHKSVTISKDLIRENFDASYENPKDDIRILITTDVLAEGVNLHRSNIIINYDLPWNPTRVLQRVGRVNRVGTPHKQIYIFNFFPTAQAEKELGLEDNIKTKIQAFHDALGEDARYLTEDEIITTHDILGAELYKRLNDKKILQGEDEDERTELEQLQVLRKIRDENPELFEKIKRIPKKARSSKQCEDEQNNQLITFFRKGNLKRTFINDDSDRRELVFYEAADILKCEPQTARLSIPHNFYSMLEENKEQFDLAVSGESIQKRAGGGKSNEKFIIQLLKANEIRCFKGFTDEEEEFLKEVLNALELGIIAKITCKHIKQLIDKEISITQLKLLAILKKNVPAKILKKQSEKIPAYIRDKKEVILSEYLVGGKD
jgi:superfamily II DNA/RNA helicase/HKD family nuclease